MRCTRAMMVLHRSVEHKIPLMLTINKGVWHNRIQNRLLRKLLLTSQNLEMASHVHTFFLHGYFGTYPPTLHTAACCSEELLQSTHHNPLSHFQFYQNLLFQCIAVFSRELPSAISWASNFLAHQNFQKLKRNARSKSIRFDCSVNFFCLKGMHLISGNRS